MTLWDEIQSQPRVLADFFERQWDETVAVAEWLESTEFTHVVMAARGSSDNAARYAQYLWGAHNGLNVALARPARAGYLIGEGRVVHRSRGYLHLEGKLTTEDGELVATATATAAIKGGTP